MDKYKLPWNLRKQTVFEQIQESQRIIYRNDLENLTFKQKNDDDKQLEVETNNKILRKKLDLLFEELDRLNAEDKTGSGTTV